jgi:hypothetical protein
MSLPHVRQLCQVSKIACPPPGTVARSADLPVLWPLPMQTQPSQLPFHPIPRVPTTAGPPQVINLVDSFPSFVVTKTCVRTLAMVSQARDPLPPLRHTSKPSPRKSISCLPLGLLRRKGLLASGSQTSRCVSERHLDVYVEREKGGWKGFGRTQTK